MGLLKDYTRKDMLEIRQYLISIIDELCDKYGTKWTDRNESDLGMFFVELAAGIADMLNFNIDKNALETYLPTAKQRKNIKKILTLINYEMLPPVAAVTKVTFTLKDSYFQRLETEGYELTFDLKIPKYTQLGFHRTVGSIYYVTSEDCEILRGTLSTECPVMQGIAKTINYLNVSYLKENRTIEINSTKVAAGSVRLIIGDEEWEQVPDVLIDEVYGKKYSVHETEKDHPYIEFHYTWKNYLPADATTPVSIQYVDTEGSLGIVRAGALTSIDDSIIIDGVDYAPFIDVINEEPSSGGADRETIDIAKIKAPAMIETGHTMCTLKDYEAFTNVVPGVHKSKAIDWNISWNNITSYYVGVPYKVRVFVVSNDYDSYICTEQFLDEIHSKLEPYLWCSIQLSVEQAPIYEINIDATIYTRTNEGNFPTIRKDIQDAVLEFFKKGNRDFGERFTIGMIEHLIDSSNNLIDYCELKNLKDTIVLEPIQFPKLGTLSLNIIKQS